MNWLDIVIVIVALVGLIIGWRMGLLGAVFNTLGVVVGVFIAARFSDDIASWFTDRGAAAAIATVLGYVVIIVGVFVAAQVARGFVKRVLNLVFLGWIDSMGAIGVGLLFGVALSGALILGLARYSNDLPEGGMGTIIELSGFRGTIQDAMVESSLVPAFIEATDAIPADAMGFVPEDFKEALDLLKHRIDTE
ncbi:MAG: CvpA family protein [Dehalococcoidia bacterium]